MLLLFVTNMSDSLTYQPTELSVHGIQADTGADECRPLPSKWRLTGRQSYRQGHLKYVMGQFLSDITIVCK